MGLRTFSYGGGVQSNAVLVLQAQGKLPDGGFDHFLFSNVGDDSEHPETLRYVREVAQPFAKAHGIDLRTVFRRRRDGSTETLYGRLTKPGSRSLPIPVRMGDTGAPGTRSCTADFKIRVIGKWLKEHGASADDPATVGIGISLDEIHRANARRVEPYERIVYPLLDLKLRRTDCLRIIADAGLPRPPRSACFFCPMHRPGTWLDMRREEPELFERAARIEDLLNERREELGKDHVFFTRFGKPLRDVVPEGVETLPFGDDPGDGSCDSGHCFT
ncbi:phosphoadenosine phosphosulfate reductase [Planomonospora sp. ID82291]|uniref:phosphoadenosine phosphosulfate reductase n=1 Tax=Planomonospora sp. ID82291 TaxID=2738136 RepID=UPI0018C37A0F|nr:phosphoadenosine phosphosulfate reductase [Planomonospora sp. ID82291]MBG0818714.1 phosphoadenosine phosphosulfate reductase [Planomonospora sp. ID82291]